MKRDLRALFDPRSVAVVGASNTPGKWGHWIALGALEGADRRSVYLVNRNGGEVGLANGAELHPMQVAFKEKHGLQCGFCTPGMIMSAVDMINRHPGGLDEKTVRAELEGNICRCTGYHNIVKAILAASETMAGAGAKAA